MIDMAARTENRKRWEGRSEVWRRFTAGGPPEPDAATLALIDAVGAEPSQRILDMASGTGDPSIPLAERVAPGGMVVATDQSAEMLIGARARAQQAEANVNRAMPHSNRRRRPTRSPNRPTLTIKVVMTSR